MFIHSTGCNNYFDEVSYFKDASLSPVCYMTDTSSVVELTCPEGHVFAENTANKVTSECDCKEESGYSTINATCLCKLSCHRF